MAFTTKKYTRPLVLQELRTLTARNYTNYRTFVKAFSPRAGTNSAKVAALSAMLGGNRNLRKYFTAGTGAARKQAILLVLKEHRI